MLTNGVGGGCRYGLSIIVYSLLIIYLIRHFFTDYEVMEVDAFINVNQW